MKQRLRLSGSLLISLVAIVLILAGVLKLVGVGAEDMVEGLKKANLGQFQTLISVTAIACGILLLLPRTTRFGWLMASAYWGGAIVAHLTYNDSVIMPASFMTMLCLGIVLTELGQESPNDI